MRLVPLLTPEKQEVWIDADRVMLLSSGMDGATKKQIIGVTGIVLEGVGVVLIQGQPSKVAELLTRGKNGSLSLLSDRMEPAQP